jgi:hypothetical protein
MTRADDAPQHERNHESYEPDHSGKADCSSDRRSGSNQRGSGQAGHVDTEVTRIPLSQRK